MNMADETEVVENNGVIEAQNPLALACNPDQEIVRLAKGLNGSQIRVCEMVAAYRQSAVIKAELAEAMGRGEVSRWWIETCSSTLARGVQQQALVTRFRDLQWERRQDIPICNAAERARERDGLVKRNRGSNDELVRQVILDADKAYGESESETPGVAVQINVGDFGSLGVAAGGSLEVLEVEATGGVLLPLGEDRPDSAGLDVVEEVEEDNTEADSTDSDGGNGQNRV